MDPEASDPKKQKPFNNYLRYSGLGLQMVMTIGIGAWLGYWIDQRLQLTFPVFLLLLVFVTFGGSMYQLYKSISNL
jgi:ATP synthase protein I